MSRHIAIYARVSTRRQDLRSQLPDLERWTASQADDVSIRWYTDKVTGTKMQRPAMDRLLAASMSLERISNSPSGRS